MTVRMLLKSKGAEVSIADRNTKVQDIMHQLEGDEVSAVVVTDGARSILGIVSAGDILRAINRRGPAVLKRPVSSVMTTEVFTCDLSEPLSSVYKMMNTNQIRHVPIINNGKLCGIINTLDVIKYQLRATALEAEVLKEYITGRA